MENLKTNLLKEIVEKRPVLKSDCSVSSEDDIYIFISLDLTNSTRFKNEQPDLWKKVIASFYDVIFESYGINQYRPLLKSLDNEIDVNFWKFVGDEVLLYANVYNFQEIHSIVKSTDECIQKAISQISTKIASSYECQKNCSELHDECDCPFYKENIPYCNMENILKKSLGIKATIWLAICGRDNKNRNTRNIIYSPFPVATDLFQNETFDFLGPEIDEGFRIAKYAVKNRIVVSPFLANTLYLSSKDDEDIQTLVENNFRIVSYQKLKGIWNDRLFPIVMYSPLFKNIHAQLEYDEIELPTYSEIKISGVNGERCKIEYLKKILRDVHLENESNNIVELLKDETYRRSDKKLPTPPIELHIACISFNKNGALLVHNHKTRGWEFGCVRITSDTNTWEKAIIEGYKKKYALNIAVSNKPIPVATYIYQKSGNKNKTALGIIVVGEFLSYVQGKENDFKPMTMQQIHELNEPMVDDFKINAQKAFEIYNREIKIKSPLIVSSI